MHQPIERHITFFANKEKQMDENKMEILKMLQDGKITADEAAELLQALEPSEVMLKPDDDRVIELMDDDYGDADETATEGKESRKKKRPRFLIIEVSKGGSKKVNVRIPLKLAKIASRFIPKHAHAQMKAHGVEGNLDELLAGLEELEPGEDLINVNDEDDDEQVRIYTI